MHWVFSVRYKETKLAFLLLFRLEVMLVMSSIKSCQVLISAQILVIYSMLTLIRKGLAQLYQLLYRFNAGNLRKKTHACQ